MPGWFPRCRARGYSQGALADHSSRARRLRAADLDEVVAAALAYSLCQAKAKKPGSLAQDTLDRHRRLSGEDHPATLHAANNLVSCLMNLNDFLAARELAEDTLERSQRTLGPDAGQTLAMAETSPRRSPIWMDTGGHANSQQTQPPDTSISTVMTTSKPCGP